MTALHLYSSYLVMVGVQTRLRIPLVRYILGFMAANTDLKMHWCRIKNIQRSCAFKRMKVCLKRLSRGALVAQLVKRVCLMHKRWVLTEAARVQNLTCSHRAACQLTLSSSFLPRYSYTIKWRYFKKKKKKKGTLVSCSAAISRCYHADIPSASWHESHLIPI